jgi:hypothetical protein
MTQRQNILTGYIMLAFLLIASMVVLTFGVDWWLSGGQSNSWPKIDGQLLQINFIETTGRHLNRSIIAEYKCEVGGTTYRGNNICYGGPSGNESELQGLHNGDTVKISVNPKNPAEAVLIPGATSGARAMTFFGSFIFLAVLVIAIALRKTCAVDG